MQISLIKISDKKRNHHQDRNLPKTYVDHQNWRLLSQNQRWIPPTDVFETEKQIVVRVEIAGMRDDAFEIMLDKNILTISGSRSDPFDNIRVFHQMEIGFGEFYIALEINIALDLEHAEGLYENGYLLVRLNKAEPKSIIVEK